MQKGRPLRTSAQEGTVPRWHSEVSRSIQSCPGTTSETWDYSARATSTLTKRYCMEMKVSGQDALASWASIDGATEIVLTEEGIVVPRASRCGPDARTSTSVQKDLRWWARGDLNPHILSNTGT
jgi:hypothetical protein